MAPLSRSIYKTSLQASPMLDCTLLTEWEAEVTTQNLSYALFELAGLLGALLVLYSLGAARTILTKRFLVILLTLHTAWLCWDYLAVGLDVYRYPVEGNIPIRVVGLPLEEHLFFPFHILFTWAVVVVVEAAKPPRS